MLTILFHSIHIGRRHCWSFLLLLTYKIVYLLERMHKKNSNGWREMVTFGETCFTCKYIQKASIKM